MRARRDPGVAVTGAPAAPAAGTPRARTGRGLRDAGEAVRGRVGGRADASVVRDAVERWYDEHHRDLPWRRTRDPYAILVSEVMLQQTQVARVVPRWEAWLARWPTAADLAAASQAEVVGAWVGLGYNSRAVRLRAACAAVVRDGWPTTAAGLRALPGVGPYTAAAVASFAFHEPVAAVDTNVRRIAERIGVGSPQAFLPADGARAARWNQAAMELGAVVCRARAPACEACPAAQGCASAHRVVVARRSAPGSRVRFEETDRYVRGRVVRALAEGRPLPVDVGADRLSRAIAGLRRDGLVARGDGPPVLAEETDGTTRAGRAAVANPSGAPPGTPPGDREVR